MEPETPEDRATPAPARAAHAAEAPDSQESRAHKPTAGLQIAVAGLLLIIVAAIAYFGSLATVANVGGWYAAVEKAPWDPPNAVFGPVWSALYILIALVGWLVWRRGYRKGEPHAARSTLALYGVQLVLNAAWTPVFFAGFPLIGRPAWWIALAIILGLLVCVIALARAVAKWSKLAIWVMLLYAAWLLFASTLNLWIILLN